MLKVKNKRQKKSKTSHAEILEDFQKHEENFGKHLSRIFIKQGDHLIPRREGIAT
jgi:hypothetical protein